MKKHHFQLDPTVKKQLQSITIIQDARVQEFIDNPSSIPTFLDFRVDYAFKYILGHKEALLKLLNDILPVRVDAVEYLPNEIPVISEKEKRSAFDVICTNKDTGERFLCEMQRLQDSDMDDRLLFYGCSLVHRQVERRSRTYLLSPVYVICVADYERTHPASVPADDFLFGYRLREDKWQDDVLSDKLQFYYLELPRLKKRWDATETNAERWCYLFRNLATFAKVPSNASGFEPIFEIARTGEMDGNELKRYLSTMVTQYDKLVIGEFHHKEGMKEGLEKGLKKGIEIGREAGMAEGREATIRAMVVEMEKEGLPIEQIARITNLSIEEVKALS